MHIFDRYRRPFLFDENASGSGGAAGGGAAGGAAAGGAAAGAAGAAAGAAAGGAAAGGAAAGGAAAGDAGAAAGGAGAGKGDPWFTKADYGFDEKTQQFFAGKNYPDEKTALSSLRQADELARARNVVIRPDAKNPKGWEGFTDLGWTPDKANYKIDAPKLAEGDVHDEVAFKKFGDVAHEARLAPWQANAVYDAMHRQANEGIKALKTSGATANRELDTKLRTEWGDSYDQKTELAKRAFAAFKPDAVTGAQMDQAMGSPQMVQLFARIGEAIGEGNLVTGDGSGMGGKTPLAARAERQRLEADPEFMKVMKNPRDAQYKDFVAKRQSLIDIEARK